LPGAAFDRLLTRGLWQKYVGMRPIVSAFTPESDFRLFCATGVFLKICHASAAIRPKTGKKTPFFDKNQT
jgi:hypothetical protein